jgi:two-component system response regulator AlgR
MHILIVDDEHLGRSRLRKLLECSTHQVVGEAENGTQALMSIQSGLPEVVLLDIQMPDMSGLEVAERIKQLDLETPPALIFCTAHDEHALSAFRVQALDYLLKPVRQSDLFNALERISNLNPTPATTDESKRLTHLQARTHKGTLLVPIADVRLFQADQKYVSLIYSEGEVVIDESLKELESQLDHHFLRVHRSFLVNLSFIKGVEKQDNSHQLRLHGIDHPIPISRRHWPAVREWLRQR